jgi:hypothetical protein
MKVDCHSERSEESQTFEIPHCVRNDKVCRIRNKTTNKKARKANLAGFLFQL